MTWDSPSFVLAIIAISTVGWILTTAIRARHGYPIDSGGWGFSDDNVAKGSVDTDRKVALLADENGRLKDMIVRLEERIAVLERIATDRSQRLHDEIEALR
jgi:hypothetical protein